MASTYRGRWSRSERARASSAGRRAFTRRGRAQGDGGDGDVVGPEARVARARRFGGRSRSVWGPTMHDKLRDADTMRRQ